MDKLVQDLAYWITEREAVRENRELGMPKPWSNDPIMRFTRFCNVRREDDKVTKWIAANWRNHYAEHSNLVPAMVLARFINRIESLDEIGFPRVWSLGVRNKILSVSDAAQCNGRPFWGNAYMITTCGVRMSKEQYVFDVADAVHDRIKGELMFTSCADAHEWLMRTKGLGSFLAAQVVADLKNTPGFELEHAADWQTWCASGPGSRKGLNYLLGRDPESPWTETKFRTAINAAWLEVKSLLPLHLQDIHMQDFQNCLCEFSKYQRIKHGGRAKNRYPG